jgi:glucokinase
MVFKDRKPADCKSAIQQILNLRYGPATNHDWLGIEDHRGRRQTNVGLLICANAPVAGASGFGDGGWMHDTGVLGIDVGGTKTLCLLVDQRYRIIAEEKFRTAPEDGRKKFVKKLRCATESLASMATGKKIKLIGGGIGVAGEVNGKDGIVESAPNLLCLEKLDLGRMFQQWLGLKVSLGNDVQLALYAEHRLGAARGCKHVLGVFFGTGVAGAAIINGQLYSGASGMGGQVGSILTHDPAGADTVASHAILDRIASKAAIAGAALGLAAKQWAPNLFKEVGTDLANVTWGALRRAIRKGDKQIEELLRARLRIAGVALSNVVNFMNPEMLVLGGGLAEEMPQLVRLEIARGLRKYLPPEISKPLVIKVARFKNNAGAVGAARLAFEGAAHDEI